MAVEIPPFPHLCVNGQKVLSMKKINRNGIMYNYVLPIAFNLGELALIVVCGLLFPFNHTYETVVFIIIAFTLPRIVARKFNVIPSHYKSPIKCAVWSLTVFLSFFLVANVSLLMAIVCAFFAALLLTNIADIKDAFLGRFERTPEQQIHKERCRAVKEWLTDLPLPDARMYLENVLPPREFTAVYYTDCMGERAEHVGAFRLGMVGEYGDEPNADKQRTGSTVEKIKQKAYRKLTYDKYEKVSLD